MAETSTKPYLIRALYEWCCDNGYTPYLAVSVDARTRVPRAHVKNGEIVMNVSPVATNRLDMGNEFIAFQARFGGVAQEIQVPVDNVSAIYARETGHGMAFEVGRPADAQDEADGDDPTADAAESDSSASDSSVPDDAVAPTMRRGAPSGVASIDARNGGVADDGESSGGHAGGGEVIAFRAPGAGRKNRTGRRGPAVAREVTDGGGSAAGPADASADTGGPVAADLLSIVSSAPQSSDKVDDGASPAFRQDVERQDVERKAEQRPAQEDGSGAGTAPGAGDEPPGGDDGGTGGQSRPGPRRSRLTRVK